MKFAQSEQQREKQTEKTLKTNKQANKIEPQGSVEEYQKMQHEGCLDHAID